MLNVAKEVAALERLTVDQLRATYAELFQESTRARNRPWLIRRIIWRLQSLEEGGLSQRALERAEELASTSDLRVTAPRKRQIPDAAPDRTKKVSFEAPGSRIPVAGTLITRRYKGRLLQVHVLADGFEFEGERYRSLSAVAKQVTGAHWNGLKFFNLTQTGDGR